jgi:hypothetical protein
VAVEEEDEEEDDRAVEEELEDPDEEELPRTEFSVELLIPEDRALKFKLRPDPLFIVLVIPAVLGISEVLFLIIPPVLLAELLIGSAN